MTIYCNINSTSKVIGACDTAEEIAKTICRDAQSRFCQIKGPLFAPVSAIVATLQRSGVESATYHVPNSPFSYTIVKEV